MKTPGPSLTEAEDPAVAQSATTEAIKKADVGDCIHREHIDGMTDGTAEVIVRPSTCWSSDATDEVAMRTDDPGKCVTHEWVSDMEAAPPIVLCLDKP